MHSWKGSLLIFSPIPCCAGIETCFISSEHASPKPRRRLIDHRSPKPSSLSSSKCTSKTLAGALKASVANSSNSESRSRHHHHQELCPPGPPHTHAQATLVTLLRNHAHPIWACDFLQNCDALFVSAIIELKSRRGAYTVLRKNQQRCTEHGYKHLVSAITPPRLAVASVPELDTVVHDSTRNDSHSTVFRRKLPS